ncbi:hypothetical protein CHUAL_004008 [Chamberlinius hualienensis]
MSGCRCGKIAYYVSNKYNALNKYYKRLHSSCLCSFKFWALAGKTTALIALYYVFSIGLTFYQKWFIEDFPFPLSVVICHLVVKFLLAAQLRIILRCWNKKERVTLAWGDYLRKLSIAGIASAMDIGLSNWSFKYITISLYTMSKSTCIVFILLFSLVLGLETLRLSLVLVVMLISSGLFMFTYSSTQFDTEGFVMVMLASVMGGLRWTVAQMVMQKKESGLTNPIDMIYHIQPWMVVGLIPLAIPFEGVQIATSKVVFRFDDADLILRTAGQVLIGAGLAFLMELSEYWLLGSTSSLTLSISGILKEIVTLYLAVKVNGDSMSFINKVGLAISVFGISLHVMKRTYRSDEKIAQTSDTEFIEASMLLRNSGESSDDEEETELIIYQANHKAH